MRLLGWPVGRQPIQGKDGKSWIIEKWTLHDPDDSSFSTVERFCNDVPAENGVYLIDMSLKVESRVSPDGKSSTNYRGVPNWKNHLICSTCSPQDSSQLCMSLGMSMNMNSTIHFLRQTAQTMIQSTSSQLTTVPFHESPGSSMPPPGTPGNSMSPPGTPNGVTGLPKPSGGKVDTKGMA